MNPTTHEVDEHDVEHAPGCERPPATARRNDAGRTWCRCGGCGATWEPRAVAQVSPYRCREHPDEPVNWRGAGCPQCHRPARRTEATR